MTQLLVEVPDEKNEELEVLVEVPEVPRQTSKILIESQSDCV